MDRTDTYGADLERLKRSTPQRCTPEAIEEFLSAMRVLLEDAAGLSGDRVHKDLRIAQVVGNLGDCYHMEDREYLDHIWTACD